MSSETSKPTLYERLGGVYSIAVVVDRVRKRPRRYVTKPFRFAAPVTLVPPDGDR